MNHWLKVFRAGAIAGVVLFMSAPSLASEKDFAGTWIFSGALTAPKVTALYAPRCTLKVDAGEVTGSCKGASGLGSIEGAVSGDTIVLRWKKIAINADTVDSTVTFRGKLDDDGYIRGEVKDSLFDGPVGLFVAQRV